MNLSLGLATCLAGLSLTIGTAAEPAVAPVTTTPTGDYAVARLELSAGLGGGPQQILLGLRDGRLAQVWFVMPQGGDQRIHLEDAGITRQDGRIAGKAQLRVNAKSGWLTLDLKVQGATVVGTCELDMTGTPYKSGKGPVRGTYAAQPLATDALAPAGSWTSFWGTGLDMSGGPQPPLVADLAQARPVWRSEAYVLTGYGNAPDSRYFSRALSSGNCGGGSSPVLADGTVYITYFTPSTQLEPALKGNPYWERIYKTEEHFREEMAKAGANQREAAWVQNHFRPVADDVVVAMDAATGATRWTTVLPLRSPNHQTHKHRGVSPVPLVVGDAIYVPNLVSRLYALDRATGKVKWERPAFDPTKLSTQVGSGPAIPSPLFLGGRLIWAGGGMAFGLDPATGAETWKTTLGHGTYLLSWSQAGQPRLVSIFGHPGKAVACIDPTDGTVVWKQDVPLTAGAPLSAVIAGDLLLAMVPPPQGSQDPPHYEGWKLAATGLTKVWEDTGIPPDENIPVTVLGGRAYLLGRQMIRCLDVATGKVLAERTFAQHGPGSNPWLGVVGDRLLLMPEGQHGQAHLIFLDQDLKDLCPPWNPHNTTTTAYNTQPIVYPVVDGRLFVRGGDGIYCYDLRRP